MQKKVLWSSFVVMCLVLIVWGFVFWAGNVKDKTCKPYADIAVAAETGDKKGCDCLKDPIQKSQCQGGISDATIFTSATRQSDPSLCEGISASEMKKACVSIVTSRGGVLSATSSQQ